MYKFTGDFEFKRLEVDLEKKLFLMDGVDIGKCCTGLEITFRGERVMTRATIEHQMSFGLKKIQPESKGDITD